MDRQILQDAIEKLIWQGVDTFYAGNQGQFDAMVYRCLKQLRKTYPHIRVAVVLAYLPTEKRENDLTDAMYPEIEGPPKYAIERRNRWMVDQAQYCLCYINHTWGGAYQFVRLAQRRNLIVHNLGTAHIN